MQQFLIEKTIYKNIRWQIGLFNDYSSYLSIVGTLKRNHGTLSSRAILRASQMSSSFAIHLQALYDTRMIGEQEHYQRQGRQHDYSEEVWEMVKTLTPRQLFSV